MFVVLVVSSEAVTIAMPRHSDLSHFTDGKEPMHTKHLGEEVELAPRGGRFWT